MYTEKKNNRGRKAWETLRSSFLHKAPGERFYRGRLCAHAVRAYVDLELNTDIHYLRFPVAVKPAGQLNNGLFLPFPIEQPCACV